MLTVFMAIIVLGIIGCLVYLWGWSNGWNDGYESRAKDQTVSRDARGRFVSREDD